LFCRLSEQERRRLEAERDEKIIRDAEYNREAARRRTEARLRRDSGLPRAAARQTFESFLPVTQRSGEAKLAVYRFTQSFAERLGDGKGLYLSGAPGGGKTHLAFAAAGVLLPQCRSVVFRNAAELMSEIRGKFDDKSGGTERELFNACTRADLLILDDLGSEKPSYWTLQTLFLVLSSRIDNLRPTVITSNQTVQKLTETYRIGNTKTPDDSLNMLAQKIGSRLTGEFLSVPVIAPDHRAAPPRVIPPSPNTGNPPNPSVPR
jgi:DNA replication protein DnaC